MPNDKSNQVEMSFAEALNLGHFQAMESNSKLIVFGLGVNDPKRIFGTTSGLVEKFGSDRIFEVPTSENAFTGASIGLAIAGYPNVTVHQRMDFFLLAMDQLVNSAAKWHFMFGQKSNVPIVIRLIVGKGWGQGPTHSQSFHAWFSSIPGLKVVVPSSPDNAKSLFLAAIEDPNPVIFIEHRWLHHQVGTVDTSYKTTKLGEPNFVSSGNHVTVISFSYLTPRVKNLMGVFNAEGITIEHVDLVSLNPINWESIFESVRKTGKLLVLDFSPGSISFASEVISKVTENCFEFLKAAPVKLTGPDVPEPTSYWKTKDFHFSDEDIARAVFRLCNMDFPIKLIDNTLENNFEHDIPNEYFKGPF